MASKQITVEAWNACARQADMARLLVRDGKTFRDVSRRVFGFYPTQGHVLDARVRAYLFAYHVTLAGNNDARIVLVREYKKDASIGDALAQITKELDASK
jgi:hypothetical protein